MGDPPRERSPVIDWNLDLDSYLDDAGPVTDSAQGSRRDVWVVVAEQPPFEPTAELDRPLATEEPTSRVCHAVLDGSVVMGPPDAEQEARIRALLRTQHCGNA